MKIKFRVVLGYMLMVAFWVGLQTLCDPEAPWYMILASIGVIAAVVVFWLFILWLITGE